MYWMLGCRKIIEKCKLYIRTLIYIHIISIRKFYFYKILILAKNFKSLKILVMDEYIRMKIFF